MHYWAVCQYSSRNCCRLAQGDDENLLRINFPRGFVQHQPTFALHYIFTLLHFLFTRDLLFPGLRKKVALLRR